MQLYMYIHTYVLNDLLWGLEGGMNVVYSYQQNISIRNIPNNFNNYDSHFVKFISVK